MNAITRKKIVLAMEMLVRGVNNENFLEPWLMCGVADGDIPMDSTDVNDVDDWYIEDDNFATLMGVFLRVMSYAKQDGGLYIDDIVSK